jgi:hypothetical protein
VDGFSFTACMGRLFGVKYCKEVFESRVLMPKSLQLPSWLKVYFWDISFEELDPQKHRSFIICRLLNEGDQNSLAWLFKTYSKEVIKDTVKANRSLSLKTARCWQNYFGLKENELCCTGIRLAQKERLF